MAATFVLRRVPLLALVPRGGVEEKQKADRIKNKQAASPASRSPGPKAKGTTGQSAGIEVDVNVTDVQLPVDTGARNGVDRMEYDDATGREGEERLGERFLRAMALLTRLARTPLGSQGATEDPTSKRRVGVRSSSARRDHDAPATKQDTATTPVASRSPSPLKQQQQSLSPGMTSPSPPKAGTGGSPMRKQLVAVNAATAPLHEHLTFEISMLLPPPIDSRQRSLQSPIRRERLRKRRRRRRRKKRLRREWQTSHTTWAPHMASDYAESQEASAWRRNQEFKLSQQMQQLDLRRATAPSAIARSISLPLLARRQDHAPVDDGESDSDSEDGGETGDEGEEEESDGAGSGDDADASDTDVCGQTPIASPSTSAPTPVGSCVAESATAQEAADSAGGGAEPAAAPTMMANCHALRHHRPAWISAELRAWLIDSGLFTTTTTTSSRRQAHAKSSSIT